MAAPLEKTRHPGVYKRGSRYVVRYRAGGRKRSLAALEATRGEWEDAYHRREAGRMDSRGEIAQKHPYSSELPL